MKSLSHVRLFATPWFVAYQAPLSMGFSSKNTGVGCHFLLQGIFSTQGLNLILLCLLHWEAGSLPLSPPGVTLLPVSKCWCTSPQGFVLGLLFLTLSCCLILPASMYSFYLNANECLTHIFSSPISH